MHILCALYASYWGHDWESNKPCISHFYFHFTYFWFWVVLWLTNLGRGCKEPSQMVLDCNQIPCFADMKTLSLKRLTPSEHIIYFSIFITWWRFLNDFKKSFCLQTWQSSFKNLTGEQSLKYIITFFVFYVFIIERSLYTVPNIYFFLNMICHRQWWPRIPFCFYNLLMIILNVRESHSEKTKIFFWIVESRFWKFTLDCLWKVFLLFFSCFSLSSDDTLKFISAE